MKALRHTQVSSGMRLLMFVESDDSPISQTPLKPTAADIVFARNTDC